MSMTPEQLLIPRYEAIGTGEYVMPWSKLKPGDILYAEPDTDHYNFGYYIYEDLHPENYPHLFKPLHWSDRREKIEMPKYVKTVPDYPLHMVFAPRHFRGHEETSPDHCTHDGFTYQYADLLPATEAEYNEFKKGGVK